MTAARRTAIVFLLALSVCRPVGAVEPNAYRGPLFRHRTVQAAWATAVAQRRPLVVMFTTDHCGYCTKMLQETYSDPRVERLLLGNAVTVLAHTRDYAELAQKLGVQGFPTSLVVSPAGDVLEVAPGYVDARQFLTRLAPAITANHRAAQAAYQSAER
ncbi:MAG: thioredoxin family protein [Planctomycetota bacterium]